MKLVKEHIVNIGMIGAIIGENTHTFDHIRNTQNEGVMHALDTIGLIAYDIGLEDIEINKSGVEWDDFIDEINSNHIDVHLDGWQDWVLWRAEIIFDKKYKCRY